jgi:hypothetical protein
VDEFFDGRPWDKNVKHLIEAFAVEAPGGSR